MKQLNLFDIAMPEIWIVGDKPLEDRLHKCRVKQNDGQIVIMDLESKDSSFNLTEGKVLAYR